MILLLFISLLQLYCLSPQSKISECSHICHFNKNNNTIHIPAPISQHHPPIATFMKAHEKYHQEIHKQALSISPQEEEYQVYILWLGNMTIDPKGLLTHIYLLNQQDVLTIFGPLGEKLLQDIVIPRLQGYLHSWKEETYNLLSHMDISENPSFRYTMKGHGIILNPRSLGNILKLQRQVSGQTLFPPLMPPSSKTVASPEELIHSFSHRFTQAYATTVPFFPIIAKVNQSISGNPYVVNTAIQVACKTEFFLLLRIFNIMGMSPYSCHDLTQYGQPFIATVLHSKWNTSFRIWLSLLIPEELTHLDSTLTQEINQQVSNRKVLPDELLNLLDKMKHKSELTLTNQEKFLQLTLESLMWKGEGVNLGLYKRLIDLGLLSVANTVCFRGLHINHVSLENTNLELFQETMSKSLNQFNQEKNTSYKMVPTIEGVPYRKVPLLLRSISPVRTHELVTFDPEAWHRGIKHFHSARHVKVISHHGALTPQAEDIYNKIIHQAITLQQENSAGHQKLQTLFQTLPDDHISLFSKDLAFYTLHTTAQTQPAIASYGRKSVSLLKLLEEGLIKLSPINFEGLLPSLLMDSSTLTKGPIQKARYGPDYLNFRGIPFKATNPHKVYELKQQQSLHHLSQKLQVRFEDNLPQIKRTFPSNVKITHPLSSCYHPKNTQVTIFS